MLCFLARSVVVVLDSFCVVSVRGSCKTISRGSIESVESRLEPNHLRRRRGNDSRPPDAHGAATDDRARVNMGEMSGVLTPHNQKIKSKGRSKTPLSKSPHPVGLLSPNDDQLERQKSLLSREAEEAMRRDFATELDENAESIQVEKPRRLEELTGTAQAPPKPVKKLSAEAVMSLYTNCIKLASENKINAKNTWSLALIDHISDIVKNEKDEDNQTNFQKASCTLEAGVKIYASRVDSFHSETFKMLGGMNKVSSTGEEEDARQGLGDGAEGSQLPEDADATKTKKRRATVNTLELPEAHSLKQLDETLVVDPLFQKTSAMFDEGGASGLLLTNLAVHKGCNICFDSEEVPDYTKGEDAPLAGTLDLSALRSSIEAATSAMASIYRITPSIDEIQSMLTEVTGVPSAKSSEKDAEGETGSFFGSSTLEGINFAEYDDEEDIAEESPEDWAVGADGFDDNNWVEDGDSGRLMETDTILPAQEGGLEWVVSSALGGKMGWAGPSHWQFRAPPRPKSSEHGDEDGDNKIQKKRGKGELTYDFENPIELDERRFELAVDEDDLLLASAPSASDTLLPPDLGYEPSNLIKLFLKVQNVAGMTSSEPSTHQSGDEFILPEGDDEAVVNDEDGDGEEFVGEAGGWYEAGEFEYDGDLINAPRRVEKIEVNYARTAKQVNVRALKQTLWLNLEESTSQEDVHSFNEMLRDFPIDNPAGHVEDISVHMAFICALHLANEHGLVITSVPTMDDLHISNVPCAVR